jgi:hypothetical protein
MRHISSELDWKIHLNSNSHFRAPKTYMSIRAALHFIQKCVIKHKTWGMFPHISILSMFFNKDIQTNSCYFIFSRFIVIFPEF